MALEALDDIAKCFLPDGHLEGIVIPRALKREVVIALSYIARTCPRRIGSYLWTLEHVLLTIPLFFGL